MTSMLCGLVCVLSGLTALAGGQQSESVAIRQHDVQE